VKMNTLCASYMSSDFYYDTVATVPRTPDEDSTDSLGSPFEVAGSFPFVEDQLTPAFDASSGIEYSFQPPSDADSQFQPDMDSGACLPYNLQQSVIDSLEVLKSCDPEKYPTKQHTPVKKIRAHIGKVAVEEERVVRRRTKNREAAQASRLRKRQRLELLEGLVAEQKAITAQLVSERETMQRDNSTLRSEVEYLKEALRTSMEGLRGVDADQLFAQCQLSL